MRKENENEIEIEGEVEEETEYIFIPDEEGNEEKYEIIYEFVSEDKQYLLVIPAESPENEDEDDVEVFAFRYEENDDGMQLYTIEDEEEWDMIEEVLETLNNEFDR